MMRVQRLWLIGCAALICGCPAFYSSGPDTYVTDGDTSALLRVTTAVSPRDTDPTQLAYVADDLTLGGLSEGDQLAFHEEIVDAPSTVFVIHTTFSDSSVSDKPFRYVALVGPPLPLNQNIGIGSASFSSGSLVLVVHSGWAYVTGEWPVTDTGVVRTSTLGSTASGEWIARISPDGKSSEVYNVGESSLLVWVGDVLLDAQLAPGQAMTYDASKDSIEFAAYNPGSEFLSEVVRIAQAAGVAIAP